MADTSQARGRDEFRAALYQQERRYWHIHPFHEEMHNGRLAQPHIQMWVSNRWYYQKSLPQKDAAIIANCPVIEVRRRWVSRILYQDGHGSAEGGLHAWLRLAEAVGLTRAEVLDERHVVAGVRLATDAYVNFARTKPWLEAIASSLTELFSPELMSTRLSAFRKHYAWIDASGHDYFASRPEVARADANYALDIVLDGCRTRAEQDGAIAALQFKCDVLWEMINAIDRATRSGRR